MPARVTKPTINDVLISIKNRHNVVSPLKLILLSDSRAQGPKIDNDISDTEIVNSMG